MNDKALDKINKDFSNKELPLLKKKERIKKRFGLYHGKGKRKRK